MALAISDKRSRLALLLALLAGLLFAGFTPARAAGTASISGTVTVAAGADVTQTTVFLLMEVPGENHPLPEAETVPDATGAYSFSGKAPGRYKIRFSHPAAQDVWNGGSPVQATAPWIELAEGQALAGQDATLLAPGSISGSVGFPAGEPPERVVIQAFLGSFAESPAVSVEVSEPAYTLEGLVPGSYRIKFMGSTGRYPAVWNGNSPSWDSAPAIVVGAGAAVSGVDAAFLRDAGNASISGTLSRTGGGAVEGETVQLFDLSDMPLVSTAAAADGTYAFSGLAAGTYKISVSSKKWNGGSTWYGGADSATATRIEVAEGEPVTGIDILLPAAGSLSGTVSGYDGGLPLVVKVYPAANPEPNYPTSLSDATVKPDGSYKVVGIPAGAVKVLLLAAPWGYLDQWYGGSLATATTLNVAEGQEVSGVDFTAVPQAKITGHVKAPLNPDTIYVRILDLAGQEVDGAIPAEDGSYTVYGLSAGSYKVEFMDEQTRSAKSWYGGKTFATAVAVTVAAGQTVGGIDSDVMITPSPTPSPSPSPRPTESPRPTPDPSHSESVAPQPEESDDVQPAGELAATGTPASLAPLGLAGGILAVAGVVLFLGSQRRSRR